MAAFLATPGLQAVYVAAPNDAHRVLVEAVAQAGLPVLCEKPMATTMEDAEAMVAACRPSRHHLTPPPSTNASTPPTAPSPP